MGLADRQNTAPCPRACNHYSCRTSWTDMGLTDRQNTAPYLCSCNHYSCRTSWMDMDSQIDRTSPHVHVPATITVAVLVGWTWDSQIDRTPPLSPYLMPLRQPNR
ncbi:hypothetical protein AVEN_259444-1 [Araneus ventricosus]|uniref:Uncharacterized protein n=1 Tax=Araneus ventricosus TaxID=182803 RepID=A0A4Y2R958_ARAVE|nr:hypothetical protein AVEN_259444-1 [Araneus ventricosus]